MSDRPTRGSRESREAAITRVYRRDQDFVYRRALGFMGSDRHQDADEITNMTFHKAFKAYVDFAEWDQPRARKTLGTITQNLARDLWKAEKHLPRGVADIENYRDSHVHTDPEPEAPPGLLDPVGPDTRTAEERLAAFFKTLFDSAEWNKRQFTIAMMSWVWAWDGAEIAKTLKTTPRAVHTARTRLRGTIERRAHAENLQFVLPDTAMENPDNAGEGDVTA